MMRMSNRQLAQALVQVSALGSPETAIQALYAYLARSHAVSRLPLVRAALRRLREKTNEIVVETAMALSDDQQGVLNKELTRRWPDHSIRFRTNSTLAGGFRLYLGEQVIDASQTATLRALQKTLMEATV